MSKGGGGGGPQTTESTVTQTNLPEYAEPYFTRLMQRSEAESLQPYSFQLDKFDQIAKQKR